MKNSKLRRVLMLAACAVLLVCLSVGATLAYLADNTNVVTNTFVAGENIDIALDEGWVYQDGEDDTTVENFGKHRPDHLEDDNRREANSYKLVPGWEYDKDPTVHVIANSGDCYVFVKVVNQLVDIEADDIADDTTTSDVNEAKIVTIASQMTDNGWTQLVVDGVEVANVFYYNKNNAPIVATSTVDQDLVVFTTFTTDDSVQSVTAYNNMTITVDAYAIQADGFGTAADAWKAQAGEFTN